MVSRSKGFASVFPRVDLPKRGSDFASAGDSSQSIAVSCLALVPWPTMAKHCKIHPETELVVVEYCPVCRGQQGGANAAKGMTAEERSKRAQKAARARWPKKAKKS